MKYDGDSGTSLIINSGFNFSPPSCPRGFPKSTSGAAMPPRNPDEVESCFRDLVMVCRRRHVLEPIGREEEV